MDALLSFLQESTPREGREVRGRARLSSATTPLSS